MRVGRNCAGDIARQIDVIDLVVLEIGRIRHYREVGAIEFETHVNLLGDAGKQLRQRLVYGVQTDRAGNAGMDVDVEFGVTGKCKKQILDLDVVDYDAIGLGLFCCLGAW